MAVEGKEKFIILNINIDSETMACACSTSITLQSAPFDGEIFQPVIVLSLFSTQHKPLL